MCRRDRDCALRSSPVSCALLRSLSCVCSCACYATVETSSGSCPAVSVTRHSPPPSKITLFRSLFAGREDVYPKRWENARTGKAGYAPVCANEWVPRICGKPWARCGGCSHQAFLNVTNEAIAGHLRGRHTLGVYPMLPVSRCRLRRGGLAAGRGPFLEAWNCLSMSVLGRC